MFDICGADSKLSATGQILSKHKVNNNAGSLIHVQDLSILKVADNSLQDFPVIHHRDYPSKRTSIPPYPINNERPHIFSRQTYQHKDVHTSRSLRKVPYMECEVDQRDILSHFHVHMARFSHRVFGIL